MFSILVFIVHYVFSIVFPLIISENRLSPLESPEPLNARLLFHEKDIITVKQLHWCRPLRKPMTLGLSSLQHFVKKTIYSQEKPVKMRELVPSENTRTAYQTTHSDSLHMRT